MPVTLTIHGPYNPLAAAGTCRHCGWALRHQTVLDDNDQPVDWYLGITPENGALDGTCYSSPDATKCNGCAGTGDDPDDPAWACEACDGRGLHADHQPAADPAELANAIDLAATDWRTADDPDATPRSFVDAARNGGGVDHVWIDKSFADGLIGPDTADAYRAVLDATVPELDAALRQLRA